MLNSTNDLTNRGLSDMGLLLRYYFIILLGIVICGNAFSQAITPSSQSVNAAKILGEHGVEEVVFAVRENGKDGHWYANLGYWSFDENKMLYGKGGRLCRLNLETGEMKVIIDDPEGTIRDPAVHYDAKKILFSWRKADSRVFHLYECDINGQNIKQLTDGIYDDIEPCYLPDGGIMFCSGRGKRWVNCWFTQVTILYRCDGDGKNIRQISANIEQDNTPWVLPDGRIIFQRWEYVDRSQVHYHHFWTTNPDGTGQMVYFGNFHPGGVYLDPKPIPGTDKVLFILSPGHGRREHHGFVAKVTDKNGPDDRSQLVKISKSDDYNDPWPLSEFLYIVAKKKGLFTMNDKGDASQFYSLPEEYGDVRIQEPRPLIKRKREYVIPSKVDLKKTTGTLILNDVYIGRNMKGVERGDIKKLLVLETLPKPINYHGGMDTLTMGGSFTMERILGTIPVEEDGSAYMELPADRAFFFVALDSNDNSVKRMQSFLSVAPGEVVSCVGCHEERGKTPVNVAKMGRLQALKRKPSKPEPIKGVPEIIDFPRDIQPILDKYCIKCHNVKDRKGGAILTGGRGPVFSHSYYMLTKFRQVADGRNQVKSNRDPRTIGAVASPLMKKINGDHHELMLLPQEQAVIRYWIESAALYPGTYAALGCGRIGGEGNHDTYRSGEKGWPTHKAFRASIDRKCTSCHKRISNGIENGDWISMPGDDPKKRTGKGNRNIIYNLTKPEESLFLLAPLLKEAGGNGMCGNFVKDANGKRSVSNVTIFASTADPDYQSMLKHIKAGKDYISRFDMQNFKPRKDYIREMKRYGILPETFDADKDECDVYDLDRKYWESLWYKVK